jgi:lipoprotein NlpI
MTVTRCRARCAVALRICRLKVAVAVAGLALTVSASLSAEPTAEQLLNQAQAANLKGDRSNALALATQAITADPKNPQGYFIRGWLYAAQSQSSNAVADFDQGLKLEPRAAAAYQLRGLEQFKLERFNEAVADFDKYLEFVPERAAHHWQRGLALYYAKRYEAARQQFEAHLVVNPNDVENAAWHFAAVARPHGLAEARATLLPIVEDRRVPMMQVYALFQGTTKPAAVLRAAQAGRPPGTELKLRLFYAHFYLGLYAEATGDERGAREHIFKAADDYAPPDFMGDVARVHAALLRKEKQEPK